MLKTKLKGITMVAVQRTAVGGSAVLVVNVEMFVHRLAREQRTAMQASRQILHISTTALRSQTIEKEMSGKCLFLHGNAF